MTVLLDTHVILWSLRGSPELGGRAHTMLAGADTRLCSVASIWEIALKRSLGKLRIAEGFEEQIPRLGMTMLAIDPAHAAAVGSIALPHPDPFDQLLVTQASVERVRFLTADRAILAAGLPFVVDARK